MSAILVPTASEEEWLAARREGITASEIAVVMGLSPYSSPYALYHQKLGILPPQDDSAVMERGRVLEPYIAGKFAEAHPDRFVCGNGRELWRHGDRPWQMATPDRTVGNPDAVLECKVDGGSDEWGEPGTDEIPVHYRAQALWQMDVMGVGTAHVACLRVRDWKVREYAVQLDGDARADLKLMRDEALDFLDRIDGAEPPDVDWRPATIAALKTLHPEPGTEDVPVRRSLAIQYRAAIKRYKEAERRKDEMTARMLQAIGDGRRAVEGDDTVVATRSVSHPRRIDTETLRSRHPAIAAECTKPPKPEVKLLPAKTKKDKNSDHADSE